MYGADQSVEGRGHIPTERTNRGPIWFAAVAVSKSRLRMCSLASPCQRSSGSPHLSLATLR
eukprot:5620775-Pyramimonas_sp.AAC.1